MTHLRIDWKGGLKLATKLDRYYQVVRVYKHLLRKKQKKGEDCQNLRKRLLAVMTNGKDKSTYSV